MTEMVLVVTEIAQHYRLRFVRDCPVEPYVVFTMRPRTPVMVIAEHEAEPLKHSSQVAWDEFRSRCYSTTATGYSPRACRFQLQERSLNCVAAT
jgi:hypothetical protein